MPHTRARAPNAGSTNARAGGVKKELKLYTAPCWAASGTAAKTFCLLQRAELRGGGRGGAGEAHEGLISTLLLMKICRPQIHQICDRGKVTVKVFNESKKTTNWL